MNSRLAATTLLFPLLLATTARADCTSDIQDILKAMTTSPPYRVQITSTASGATSQMQAEVIMPDSMHIHSPDMEIVMTPNGVWMKQGNSMDKMPDSVRTQMQDTMKQGMGLGLANIEAAECLGMTDFDGASYETFKYATKAKVMDIESKSVVQLFVGGDRRPVGLLIDGEAMGVKSVTKQKIEYDNSITIADPK